MRAGITGFVLGAGAALLACVIVQRLLIHPVAGDLSYHFYTCVFDEAPFPGGDLGNGRLIRRALLPVKVVITFYDAGYHEVKQADHPGRYGAVVRIDAAGTRSYRFITLYRVPSRIFWDDTSLSISAKLPPQLGFNPAVLRAQQHQIGEMIQNSLIDEDGHFSTVMAILFAGLSETPPDAPPAVDRTNAFARDAAWWDGLRQRLGLAEKYRYLVDLPKGYATETGKRWPLILFLGSAYDRGTDLQLVRRSGLAGVIARGKQLPAIVVSPQCPAGEDWDPRVLSRLLDKISAHYRVDPDRVEVTGISAGGDATWALALAHPERFAAVVPICGDNDPADAARLKNLPLWAFQGEKDDVVPLHVTVAMVDAIRRAGGHPHLTVFPHTGHDAWDKAYAIPALYTWLLAQKRGQPEVLTPGVPASP